MDRGTSGAIVCLVAALVTASACGGGGDHQETATTAPATIATTSSSAPAVADRQALLDQLRTSFGSPGALAVFRDGDAEWRGVSGDADVAGTPLTDETRFRIGSITKSVVAALVLDEVGRGGLSLEDKVADLLPDTLRPVPPITVRMLLDHTSGVFNAGDEGDIIADIDKLADPALRTEAADLAQRYLQGEKIIISDTLFVALAETHDRYFDPGAGYHYSNVNFQLAGMVLEKVTGMSIADLVRTRIVEPLGLGATTLAPSDAGSPEMRGYALDATDGSLDDLTDDLLALGNGAGGGLISTADETLTMMQAIVSGRLATPQLVVDMKHATAQSDESYGLGLATYYLSCGTFYGHGGAIDGFQSIAVVDANGTAGVVIAVNLRQTADPKLLAVAESFLCTES